MTVLPLQCCPPAIHRCTWHNIPRSLFFQTELRFHHRPQGRIRINRYFCIIILIFSLLYLPERSQFSYTLYKASANRSGNVLLRDWYFFSAVKKIGNFFMLFGQDAQPSFPFVSFGFSRAVLTKTGLITSKS